MSVINDVKDDLDTDNIEATLGRIVDGHGKNRPFVHTCEQPSQTCECWIATQGETRPEFIWLSTRPNRRTRRFRAARGKEPLRNDGTPKRFIGTARPSHGQTERANRGGQRVEPGIQRSTGTGEAESGTAGQSREDR